jgi:hypothetical protein
MQISHSPYIGQSMDSTAVKLLQAAGEFVGDEKQLAVPPGIARTSGRGGDSAASQ